MNQETRMDDKFHRLTEIGAGDFEHLDGSLIEHSVGTRNLLDQWSASDTLKDAGLYHAAYGTAGFNEKLISVTQRDQIRKIIGDQAEEIVYQYCACDRQSFYAQIGVAEVPEFKNRFTGDRYRLPSDLMMQFCEFTAANETEIAMDNPNFLEVHGEELSRLFSKMTAYLSDAARVKTAEIFAARSAK